MAGLDYQLPKVDLTTPEGRAAYRAELRPVGQIWRLAGLTVIITAATILAAAHWGFLQMGIWGVRIGLIVLAAGWVLLAIAFTKRNAYHRKRTSGGSR